MGNLMEIYMNLRKDKNLTIKRMSRNISGEYGDEFYVSGRQICEII